MKRLFILQKIGYNDFVHESQKAGGVYAGKSSN